MKPTTFLLILCISLLFSFCSTANAESDLVGWWKFDEGSGTIAYDSAGSNNGTVTGATWTTEGEINGALSFDGSDDYVALSSFTVSTNNGTIALWFQTSADFSANYGSYGYLISQNSQYDGYLAVAGNGTVPYGIYGETNSNNDNFVAMESVVPVGVWNHIAVSFYNKTAKTYLNGLLIQTLPVTSSSLTLTRIGGRTQEFFNGKIDNVRVYDRELSAEEIRDLYGGQKASVPNPVNGAAGVSPDIVLHWSPGKDAASHDVYLGTNYNDVNDADVGSPEYMGNFDVNSYDPGGLEEDTFYYWRIDEVNDPNLWKGDVWSFNTNIMCVVPNVVGMTQANAITAINNAGLVVGTITDGNGGTTPIGSVYDQSPTPGVATCDTPVNINVAAYCMKSTHPDYTFWVLHGKPKCWCYAKQCRGDINGAMEGPFWVSQRDKVIFMQYLGQFMDPPPPSLFPGPCADLNHIQEGPFWVSQQDKVIFIQYLSQMIPPPDCDSTHINFWCTPGSTSSGCP
jgi:hypothetical protein